MEIKLPPKAFLESFSDGTPRGCTFALRDAEQAARHAISLLAIIRATVISKSDSRASLLYGQDLVWLLDSLQSWASALTSWPTSLGFSLDTILQITIDLVEAHSVSRDSDMVLYHKAGAVLALVCTDLSQNPKSLLAEDEDGVTLRRVFCLALLWLGRASHDHVPTSRLVASSLIPSAHRLVLENPLVGEGTDVWVGSALFLPA
jgi:serine/threonine-protein kinase ATR